MERGREAADAMERGVSTAEEGSAGPVLYDEALVSAESR